ncbi:transcriptional regulator, TetR family [Kordiimonas lacus]|uniref:Transcriptional regulator, TetR family n=2 Tax=Kordiimonas lacus TaxID=637679 RepID=A0A1G7F516_9PROT|nr:transcriptional regulator, TetR family [Kordiimonas lacus]
MVERNMNAEIQMEVTPFHELLESRFRQARGLSKGERTKNRLKVAAAKQLNELDFINLRVADICRDAAVSTATFHRYFLDRTEIATDVLDDYLEAMREGSLYTVTTENEKKVDGIYLATLAWLKSAEANPGILKCLLQLRDEAPQFAESYQKFDHYWYQRIADNIRSRSSSFSNTDESVALVAAYALGGMVDDITRKIFIQRDTKLLGAVERIAPTPESLAKLLSMFWHRMVYGGESKFEMSGGFLDTVKSL